MVKEARKSSTQGVTLRFHMATFCRMILQEPDTTEASLVGVLPGLNVHAHTTAKHAKEAFNLQMPLWVYACFRVPNPPDQEIEEIVEGILKLNDKSLPVSMPLKIKPGELFSSVNIRLAIPEGFPVQAGLQTVTMTFKHNGERIGSVELPINVSVVIK